VEPLPKVSRTGANFETEWARGPGARASRRAIQSALVSPALRTLTRPRVKGLDRLGVLDHKTPAIFAANHHSHIDTPLLLTTIPAPWRNKLFVGGAADYFFANRVSGTISALALNVIPVERGRVNRRSAEDAADLVDRRWSMVIFPEGGRSPDGWAQEFRGGAAYLAVRCGVPVVPIHIAGTDHILPKGQSRPRRGPTTVTFGDPLFPDDDDRRVLADRLARSIAELADSYETDWWQARKRAHRGDTPSTLGPQTTSWRRAWAKPADTRSKTPDRAWPHRGG
jgi:1-acyl-sn-glycerol-3-phosphate acyltransferase